MDGIRTNEKLRERLEIQPWMLWVLCFSPVVLAGGARLLLDFLRTHTVLPSEVCMFLSFGTMVHIPLCVAALILAPKEKGASWLGIRLLKLADWIWIVVALAVILIMANVMMVLGNALQLDTSIPFMDSLPLNSTNRWIAIAWIPFFFFNILGEELWWRGFLLPFMDKKMPRLAWLINGVGWGTYHIAYGLGTLFTGIPMFLLIPQVTQFRKNTSVALILHGVFGALGFLMNAFATQ